MLRDFSRFCGYGVGIFGAGICIHQYMKIQMKRLEESVFKKVEIGHRPKIPHKNPNAMIPRESISNQMVSLFFPHLNGDTDSTDESTRQTKKSFGLIVGPTGSGKTALVTKECNRFPKGVLYYNVCEPEMFTKKLAEEIGMKVGPSNIFDLILGYFSSDLFLYYHLPENKNEAVSTIIDTLASAAEKFKSKYGTTPTMFIDGADVLAKFEENVFLHLLQHAKELANEEVLTIVFVSSEGSILPLIQKSSTFSRSVKMFEVADINDHEATDHLENAGISKQLSKSAVAYTGGRFIYLDGFITLHRMYKKLYPDVADKLLFEMIKEDLFAYRLNVQSCAIEATKPTSEKLILDLMKSGQIDPSHYYGTSEDIEGVIIKLIKVTG